VLTACLGKVEGVKSEGGFTEQLCSDLREVLAVQPLLSTLTPSYQPKHALAPM